MNVTEEERKEFAKSIDDEFEFSNETINELTGNKGDDEDELHE